MVLDRLLVEHRMYNYCVHHSCKKEIQGGEIQGVPIQQTEKTTIRLFHRTFSAF